jgi:endo-1,4-beta-xylanase
MLSINLKKPKKILLICIILLLVLFIPVHLTAEPSFIGNVIGNSGIPANFTEYWNQVTSENAAKWGSAESSRDNINWSTIQSHYDFAKNNGFPYKFHVLVWGSQEPGWISGLSQSEQRAEIEEWISGAGQRFNCEMWDVVNEPLHAVPSYKDALGGDGATGWDWVIEAFELANQHCSGTLLINEYGIVNDSSALSRYLEIVELLQSRGLVDGIGVQAHHFNVDDYTAATLQSNVDRLAETGLGVYVSEFDSQGDDQTQLSNYSNKFSVFLNHSAVKGITLWGYIQGETWRDNTHLVSSASVGASERPAMQWLKPYLKGGTTLAPGETPTPTPTPVPTDEPLDCSGVPEWSADAVYADAGTRVQYNGNLYENNWYSSGQNPEEYSDQYEVWTLLGSCGTGPTATPVTVTPTPVTVTPTPETTAPTVTPTPPATKLVWFVPASQEVGLSSPFTLEIHGDTGTQTLAAYGFNVIYDSGMISLNTEIGDSGVEEGADGFVAAVNGQEPGTIVISGFDASGTGPGSDLHIVTIHFIAGDTAGTTEIILEVNDYADTDTNSIGNPSDASATVIITDVSLGDTNSDGTIDIIDALLTAQYYVQLEPDNFNPGAADTNCDGEIDIIDALLIAQYYVGLITQFC